MNWSGLLAIIAGGLLVWMAVRMIRQNPESFSRANLSKSFSTVGVLALMLIVIIAFCIMMLKGGL